MPHGWNLGFTILIIYDRFCSLSYTTDLLKDRCFPCISPSYNKNAEMLASIIFLEHYNIFLIDIWCLSQDVMLLMDSILTYPIKLDQKSLPSLKFVQVQWGPDSTIVPKCKRYGASDNWLGSSCTTDNRGWARWKDQPCCGVYKSYETDGKLGTINWRAPTQSAGASVGERWSRRQWLGLRQARLSRLAQETRDVASGSRNEEWMAPRQAEARARQYDGHDGWYWAGDGVSTCDPGIPGTSVRY